MLDALKSLLPPPADGPARPRASWADAEETLGVRFPDGYKEVVDTYGTGAIDGELSLLDPRWTERYWRVVEDTLTAIRKDHDEDGEYPLPGFPAPGRRSLLTIGGNGNGDNIHLTVDDRVADESELWIVNYRALKAHAVAGPVSALLVDVVTHRGRYDDIVGTFGEYTWRLRPTFEPFRESA